MKWLKRAGFGLALLLVTAALFLVPTVYGKPWKIEHFYMRVLVSALLDDPLLLTQLKMLESIGLTFHADDLPDQTLALRTTQVDRLESQIETLKSYDREALEPDQRVSYDVMLWMLEHGIGNARRFLKHPYAVDQLQGLHVRFPDVMVNYHLIESTADARAYVTRVEKVGPALQDLAKTAATLEQEGYTIPRFILEKIAADARAFAEKTGDDNPLQADFAKKVESLSDRDALNAALAAALKEQALPGYARFATAMEEMAKRAPDDAGVWHLPEGDAYYQTRIRALTSTEMTAAQIHQIGLTEVARIQAEMDVILATITTTTSTHTFGDRLRSIASDDRHYFEDSEAGRKAIVARYEEIIREIEGRLDEMFLTNPKAPLDVDPVPVFKQETAPFAYYFPAAMDGSKPGTFFANLRDVREHPKFGMRTLAYHEAIPGHHFQASIARAQKHLPLFRQLVPFNAYTEGWALYAEQLAAEKGFQEDPLDRLGYLNAQLFRAVRLVVDTGLHAQRWPRDRAVKYAFDNTGMKKGEVETEIDRYCVWPGQALGYMVGRIAILRMRDRAQKSMGERFDLRRFHDALLLPGALPLELLEKEVDRFIASK